VARAKRTARAEARRRYRAEQGVVDVGDAPMSPAASARTDAAPPPGRISMAGAFRLAFRPLDIRGDIRDLPTVAMHSKALWVPIALTVAGAVFYGAVRPEARTDLVAVIALFMFQYFVATPAIGGAFIAGFFAPKASWLLGAIVGIVAAICYSVLILGGFVGNAPTPETQALAQQVVVFSLLLSPVIAGLLASAAAWYRRFLQLSNPNRGRAQPPRRGKDGRSRSASTQKAGVRR